MGSRKNPILNSKTELKQEFSSGCQITGCLNFVSSLKSLNKLNPDVVINLGSSAVFDVGKGGSVFCEIKTPVCRCRRLPHVHFSVMVEHPSTTLMPHKVVLGQPLGRQCLVRDKLVR